MEPCTYFLIGHRSKPAGCDRCTFTSILTRDKWSEQNNIESNPRYEEYTQIVSSAVSEGYCLELIIVDEGCENVLYNLQDMDVIKIFIER